MPAHLRPTVRRRRLGAELKRLCEAAGVSMDDAGEHIDGDKTKISRIENGRQGIRPLEIKALFDRFGVEDEKLKTALLTLAREAKRKGWWQQYGDTLRPDFQELLALEWDAARIHTFQAMVVPGLLQTSAYAEAINRGTSRRSTEEEIQNLVRLRMERQSIFEREEPPQYLCILDEAVLHHEVGGSLVMAGQLRRLLEVGERPGLSVQVVPYAQGGYVGLEGPFTIYSYPEHMALDVVGLNYLDGALYLEEDGSVERYRRAFDQVRAAALSSRQSMDLISQLARDFEAK
ncbi:helix-turn-helix domain-containing protein [Streptomyces acidiscabies]|uniref:helix-turn-helix domain-containing protein n=1 Tax=Streptomyces acidiscabies TaxID=42234 RepID=UPI00073E8E21|nr:helix-turn-helix transcriptional regulator [Streptomyces acidiscabies]